MAALNDGVSVRGRLLNHDQIRGQLIDSKERLRSFAIQLLYHD